MGGFSEEELKGSIFENLNFPRHRNEKVCILFYDAKISCNVLSRRSFRFSTKIIKFLLFPCLNSKIEIFITPSLRFGLYYLLHVPCDPKTSNQMSITKID